MDEKLAMAYAVSCCLQNKKIIPLSIGPSTSTIASPETANERNIVQQIIPQVPGRMPIVIPNTRTEDQNSNINNNKNQQLIRQESEDPFMDSNISPTLTWVK